MLENPSIEQSLIQSWEHTFITLAQQENSLLTSLPAVKMMAFQGVKHNVPRAAKTELDEALGRNPLKQYDEFEFDNRQFTKQRFTKTFAVDKKDIREAMADPTSEIYKNLFYAVNRKKDEIIAKSALANVLVGDPNSGSMSSLSAASDGVTTIDATGGLTYSILTGALGNFINKEVVPNGDIASANLSFICAGTDQVQLLAEDKFINNFYTTFRPVDSGSVNKVLGMNIVTLGGSETGVFTKDNPILNESGTTRDCLLLAPNALAFTIDNLKFKYLEDDPKYVDSASLTIYCEMGGMRLEGSRVQKIQTTF